MGKKSVVDGATGDAQRRGLLKRLEVILVIDAHDCEPFPDISQKQHRLVPCHALPARPAGH